MAKEIKQTEKAISIRPIQISSMTLPVIGTTNLLMEKMSNEIREQLKNIVTGKGKEKRKNRDLDKEVLDKIHKDSKGHVGFPASGFKKAIVEASPYLDGMSKKLAKSIIIVGDLEGDLASIKYSKQTVNKAVGRDSGINRAPREIWRPEFHNWSTVLHIKFNASQITPEQIVELTKLAGFHIGVGSWTPQHNGSYGMFTVVQSGKRED